VDEIEIPFEQGVVSASAAGRGSTVVVLGHGAGGTRRTPQLVRAAEAIAGSGRRAVLYNFRYADQGRRAPDPPKLLEATAEAVASWAASQRGVRSVVLGGRSMGGRIASQVVAAGVPAAGLLFFAYPLHPPGRTEKLRDAHLAKISAPMLFLQGTRDSFAREDLLEKTVKGLGKKATLRWIEGGDHSFKVKKNSGRSPEQVEGELLDAAFQWLEAIGV
jgi:predicted alpha/beta-hydrolase family hydrolase